MDGEFVKYLDEEVAQDYALASALVSNEERHPAITWMLDHNVFENIANVVKWFEVEPGIHHGKW